LRQGKSTRKPPQYHIIRENVPDNQWFGKTLMEALKAIFIHLVVPLLGLFIYKSLIEKMRIENVEEAPELEYFFIFVTYGGWLMVVLTSLFWYWSGMASIGVVFLIVISPVLLFINTIALFLIRNFSKYHSYAFWASLSYVVIELAVLTGFAVYKNA